MQEHGLDESTNYLRYRTLGMIPEDIAEEFMEEMQEEEELFFDEETSAEIKKLKCISCGREWYVNSDDVENVRFCPFCSVSAVKHRVPLQPKKLKRKTVMGKELLKAYDKKNRSFLIPQGYEHVDAAVVAKHKRVLEYIIIPESVRSIDRKALKVCKQLKWIEVDGMNENYTSLEGWLYDKKTGERVWP